MNNKCPYPTKCQSKGACCYKCSHKRECRTVCKNKPELCGLHKKEKSEVK